MIDIHSHILPGVDDGCADFGQALSMAKTALSQGVTDVILTPHYRMFYNVSFSELKERFDVLKEKLKQEAVPINLYLGQEIFVDKDFKENLRNGKVTGLGGTNVLLLEFDYHKFVDIPEIVYEIKSMGFKPICAHVERYSYFTVDQAYEVKEEGGYIQVNAGSLFKKLAKKEFKVTDKLFEEGLVDFVASDVHFARENLMGKAYEVVSKRYGESVAKTVFETNAREIILKDI